MLGITSELAMCVLLLICFHFVFIAMNGIGKNLKYGVRYESLDYAVDQNKLSPSTVVTW